MEHSKPCAHYDPRRKNSITAFIDRPMRQGTVLRCLNRMNDLVRFRFQVMCISAAKTLSSTVDPVAVRAHIGMVFQQTDPLTSMGHCRFRLRLNRYSGDTARSKPYDAALGNEGRKLQWSSRREDTTTTRIARRSHGAGSSLAGLNHAPLWILSRRGRSKNSCWNSRAGIRSPSSLQIPAGATRRDKTGFLRRHRRPHRLSGRSGDRTDLIRKKSTHRTIRGESAIAVGV